MVYYHAFSADWVVREHIAPHSFSHISQWKLIFKPGACGRHAPGFLELFLCGCMRMCVCPPPRLLINSGVMWCDIDPIRLVE